ncbi:hypothetical protein ACGYLR_01915 [Leuconostoc lactis]|uniref:hypothetical protein n=1 Tax=Leuconostoc lactis TaxID=1246 RepID=UPI003745142D
MSKQYYDDFSKLPLAKMAQAISDMTYLFEETKVPAKHYKEHLGKGFEEMVEASVSVSLVNTIYNTLSALNKESPKLFFEALLGLETGVKPSAITPSQYQALEFTWSQFDELKQKNLLDQSSIQTFNQVEENGLTYFLNKDKKE